MSKPFELPEEMTIYSALETRDALLAWVTEQSAKSVKVVEISAALVSEIDGSGLQLLASLAHMDQPWRLVDPSDALLDAGKTLGLGDWLNEQIAIA
ncbi:MAG: STAS domain-containing protein [Rhodoferax sp.]|uniref:STAS domain-containing protein n=1 Tax=Rhodoferax sp. TaxID=50421 RepID=UPI00260574F7|nr:STAS domain-containing protein [Rhodoferax sp.]MDD2881548.1 STAS domain-containing protein [Rhodoferax sp.]